MRSRWIAALAALPAACGDALPSPDHRPDTTAHPATEVTATVQDSLRLRILAPPAAVAGEPLPVTLRVENASGRTLELHLRGRTIAFDLIARSAAGDTVWRRLDGAVIPAILRLQPLAADGVLELEERWLARDAAGEPLPAGDYTITGELLTDGEPLRSPPAPLRITDG